MQVNLDKIIDLMPNEIIALDNKGRVCYCSRPLAIMFGYQTSDIIGKRLSELETLMRVDFDTYRAIFYDTLSGKITRAFELSWSAKNGREYYGIIHPHIIRNNGLTEGVYFIIEDISKSKLSDSKLEESEYRYSALVEGSRDGILILKGSKISFVNNAAVESLGYSYNELVGTELKNFISIDYHEYFDSKFSNCSKDDSFNSFCNLDLIRKDGSIFPAELSSSKISQKDEKAFLIFARDISQRSNYQLAVKKSEKLFKTVVDASKDAMITINDKGIISLFNPAAENMFGYSSNDIIGKPLGQLMPENYRNDHVCNLRSFFSIGKPNGAIKKIVELPAIRKNGENFPIALSLATGYHENEKFVLAVIRDITEKKKNEEKIHKLNSELEKKVKSRTEELEIALNELTFEIEERKKTQEELVRINKELKLSRIAVEDEARRLAETNKMLSVSKEKLKEINASKDKFFSIIAHDLRGPFSGFLGLSELIAEQYYNLDKEDIEQMTGALYKNAKSLYNFLENLLEWSRIQRGVIDNNPTVIRLYKNVAKNIQLLECAAEKKNIIIINNIDAYQTVFTDENMLNTIFRNLISNAIKFTNTGGEVLIYCDKQGKDSAVIKVKDNGVGIKENDLTKLFRIDSKHTTKGTLEEKGSGIGLLLCKELVEKLGGEIFIESAYGKGSEFSFTVPIQQ